MCRYYHYTVPINFICSRFSHPFSYLPGYSQQKDHLYLKNVQLVKAVYIWNQGIFIQTSDELSGVQEHPFEAATVQKTLLYSVLNLRIKLAGIFPSPNQAMLRLLFCSN